MNVTDNQGQQLLQFHRPCRCQGMPCWCCHLQQMEIHSPPEVPIGRVEEMVPVSDFDLGTHPRAGSTRGARGVGAGSRVRRLAMVWRFVGSPAVVVVGNSSWDKGETGVTVHRDQDG
ncbi:hypothetical protein ACOMHN_065703 [Nucella lapillus]